MDQYTRAAMSSSSPEPPSGTITVGRPALTPMPRIRLWKACWSGSIHLISRWSIMRGARVLPKSSSKAPGMCPPAVASDFAPFSLVNVGALAKVAGSPRTSMMLTSLRCCASHCGLTSGPGRSTALATAVPSSANTMARMLLMPAFMLISRTRPRGALVNKLIEGRQLGRDRHPALADHLHAAVVEQSGAPPAAATAHLGQRRGVITGGSMVARNRVMSANMVSFVPPSFSAGCGGIDLFSGSFSFINMNQFVDLMRAVAANAAGYAFQMAQGLVNDAASLLPGKVQNDMKMSTISFSQGVTDVFGALTNASSQGD